jgi:hypothetical protein
MKALRFPIRLSQALVLASLCGLLWLVAAPFQGVERSWGVREAGAVPLLVAGGVRESVGFQSAHFVERVARSGESVFQSAILAKLQGALRRDIVVRKVMAEVPVVFAEDRVSWQRLDAEARRGLDGVAGVLAVAVGAAGQVDVRGSGTEGGDLAVLRRADGFLGGLRLRDGEEGQVLSPWVVVGNGLGGSVDGRVEVLVPEAVSAAAGLEICLVGDFHRVEATVAQWQALVEVLDYLRLKWGRLEVRVMGGDGTELGMGPYFPGAAFLRKLKEAWGE